MDFISHRMDLATSETTWGFEACILTMPATADLKFLLDSDATTFFRPGVMLHFLVEF